jgi:hypothetical protein
MPVLSSRSATSRRNVRTRSPSCLKPGISGTELSWGARRDVWVCAMVVYNGGGFSYKSHVWYRNCCAELFIAVGIVRLLWKDLGREEKN